ncbi:hypothetical protein GCM10009720_25510 [Yaniella flava]|uniref:Uncharacterized protein n=1 Tax=Yaniella flava TaxID=287930 RepID=A0ABN2UUR1_9MICC
MPVLCDTPEPITNFRSLSAQSLSRLCWGPEAAVASIIIRFPAGDHAFGVCWLLLLRLHLG